MVLGAGVVSGQDYPNRPIRILTQPPGGGTDFASRLIAPGLAAGLNQQVIVDNRAGVIAIETAAKAPADGYTLLLYSNGMWLLPFLRDNVPWDPERDFSPITLATRSPNILVVHPSLPVKSVKELIALAKARPAELNYSSAGASSMNHLAAELFKAMAGADMVHVPYKGGGPALGAAVGGEVSVLFAAASPASPHVKSGRLRALAVTSAAPSALFPGLPTVAASGLPGYEATLILGIFAPAKSSAAIINRLNREIVRVLDLPDVKERFLNAGVEAVGSSPGELAAAIKADMARWGKVIKDAGIKAD